MTNAQLGMVELRNSDDICKLNMLKMKKKSLDAALLMYRLAVKGSNQVVFQAISSEIL